MRKVSYLCACLLMAGCSDEVWNRPYEPDPENKSVYYTSFSERPKHLDPARSYSSNEWAINALIYEPLYQYDYCERPYKLQTLLASQLPVKRTAKNAQGVPITEYIISLKKGIMSQPHPAFVRNDQGAYQFHNLSSFDGETVWDFNAQATQEVTAYDIERAIKRIADPNVQSPIFGIMSEHLPGLATLRDQWMESPKTFVDDMNLESVSVLDPYSIRIEVKNYPQFDYWLAMPFFAPVFAPVLKFYDQPILQDKNISLDRNPVGTGPYYMSDYQAAHKIELKQNPYFRGEYLPESCAARPEFLPQMSLPGPYIDVINMMFENESIPRWHKFVQGYYDTSGVGSDTFDQAISTTPEGLSLSDELIDKGIRLDVDDQPSVFYWGFNWLDEVVGGAKPENAHLRQAISIAVDVEEYIAIFLNGRGEVAHSPIPKGIFGYEEEFINPVTHDASGKRRTTDEALDHLVKAGYPSGIDAHTGRPLKIFYDTVGSSSPESRAQFTWMQKQFEKIGLELIVRDTQYNRFQDKMRNGTAQFFGWGWNADYPDPENFYFLLAGANSKTKYDGENASNYDNPKFDVLFNQMKQLSNSPERQNLIHKMNDLLVDDAPWIWGTNPTSFVLRHDWNGPYVPHALSRSTLKYLTVNKETRKEYQRLYNKPKIIGLWVIVGALVSIIAPCILFYSLRQYRRAKRVKLSV